MRERLEKLGNRWPWVGLLLAVQDRFSELQGGAVASSITLNVFVSLFPLILVVISVVGFISGSNHNLTHRIIDDLGLTGNAAQTMTNAIDTARRSAKAASIIGLLGLAWSGLGVIAAVRRGVNLPWQVTGQGIRDKLIGVPWLAGAAVIFIASFALSTLLDFLPGFLAPLAILIGLGVNFGLFLWTFWLLAIVRVPWRRLVPGAIVAAVGFEILKVLGSVLVPRLVASSSALYGSLGIVFAVITWLLFFGRLLVYSSVLNVVVHERSNGTVTLEIEAPRIAGEVPVETTRAGVIVRQTSPDDGRPMAERLRVARRGG